MKPNLFFSVIVDELKDKWIMSTVNSVLQTIAEKFSSSDSDNY